MPKKNWGKDKSKVKSRKGSTNGFVLDVQCRCKFGSFTISSNSRCHLSSCILSAVDCLFLIFLFAKCVEYVKRSAIATLSPELLRYPPFFRHLFCIIDVIFRILQLFSKFGQR